MQLKRILLIAAVGSFIWASNISQRNTLNFSCKNFVNVSVHKIDTVPKESIDTSKKNTPRPYNEVVTKKALTQLGVFAVHKIDQQYLFEIPGSLLDKDILVVNRIAKAAAGNRPGPYVWGYAGDEIGESVIRFSRGPDNKIFIKLVSYLERSLDSSENGMYHSVRNSNLLPIIISFPIKAVSPDSSAFVIDVTSFFNSDNNFLVSFNADWKSRFGLGALLTDKSYIEDIQAFSINVELQTTKTYSQTSGQPVTYELNTSFVLLPRNPMTPRFADPRIGYFSEGYFDFDVPQGVEPAYIITRWRLEPKDEDKEIYLKGELVEPKKPIVFYIDPATPKKWIPYLIQGVNDWQKAFEKAGFKNAIYAREAPLSDPQWNLYDAEHSAIVYKASLLANASGPQIHDPRSGEIIEAHVNWYNNVMQLIHDWYMIQAGPNDPKARTMAFDDSLMGQLIRFVCCHEVGHTLGLMHNFGASSTVPVDSLRNKKYLEANGFCPSIMDYARFNYVAQQEDSISEKGLFPRIGVYDEWAIEWGYRWIPQLKTREDEKTFMNQWIIAKLKEDKRLWYGAQGFIGASDPRCQSEDLGDDAVKAGNYGIENLKKVNANLLKWTEEANEGYQSLNRIRQGVFNQYTLYLLHAANNIGLPETSYKTMEEGGNLISFVSSKKQKEAISFLNKQLFKTPSWLLNKDILLRIPDYNLFDITAFQDRILIFIISVGRYTRMTYSQIFEPAQSYSFDDCLTDLQSGLFDELSKKGKIDFYRRCVQKAYVDRLINEINVVPTVSPYFNSLNYRKQRSDYLIIIQSHIRTLLKEITNAIVGYKDAESKRHLEYINDRLKQTIHANPLLKIPLQLGSGDNGINVRESLKQEQMQLQCFPSWNNWWKENNYWVEKFQF